MRWAAAVVAAVGVTVAAGQLMPHTLTATALPQNTAGQVQQVTTVCPGVYRTPDTAEAVTAISLDPAPVGSGEIVASDADPLPLPTGGVGTRTLPATAGASVRVTAGADSVATTATVREYVDPADEGRGLALSGCVAPRSEWWFTGTSAVQGRIDTVLLTNPTSAPAVVLVEVFGPAGRLDLVGTSGVVVQPNASAEIRVDSLAPGTSNATVHLMTTAGLVSAALRSTSIDGLIPLGSEYLPASDAPAVKQVVPGVLAGAGERTLILTAPTGDAAAHVRVVTASGIEDLEGQSQVPIPAGHTVVVDLAPTLLGRAGAVVVSSSSPVTAAVSSTVEGTLAPDATGVLSRRPVADVAFSAAQAPIASQWRLPLSGVAAAPGVVGLSVVGGPASVTLEVRAANGATWQQQVDIAADTAMDISVPVTADSASIVTVNKTGGAGELHAAVSQSGSLPDGPVVAQAVGFDPSIVVEIPFAYPDPQVLGRP